MIIKLKSHVKLLLIVMTCVFVLLLFDVKQHTDLVTSGSCHSPKLFTKSVNNTIGETGLTKEQLSEYFEELLLVKTHGACRDVKNSIIYVGDGLFNINKEFPGDTVILTTFRLERPNKLLNMFVENLRVLKLLNMTLMVGTNAKSCEFVSPCYLDKSRFGDGHPPNTKWIYIHHLVKSGKNVVFLDWDVMLFDNPIKLLETGVDILGISDHMNVEALSYCLNGVCIGTSVMAFKSNKNVANYMDSFIENFDFTKWEQSEFNIRLREATLNHASFSIISPVVFLNIAQVDLNLLGHNTIGIHLGYVHGEDKVAIMENLHPKLMRHLQYKYI